MTNNPTPKNKYDLEERTAKFSEEIIRFAKKIPENSITRPLIIQLVKSGTSVGANYCEADDAESEKDFQHKIGICKKEARETKHWLSKNVCCFLSGTKRRSKIALARIKRIKPYL